MSKEEAFHKSNIWCLVGCIFSLIMNISVSCELLSACWTGCQLWLGLTDLTDQVTIGALHYPDKVGVIMANSILN